MEKAIRMIEALAADFRITADTHPLDREFWETTAKAYEECAEIVKRERRTDAGATVFQS